MLFCFPDTRHTRAAKIDTIQDPSLDINIHCIKYVLISKRHSTYQANYLEQARH